MKMYDTLSSIRCIFKSKLCDSPNSVPIVHKKLDALAIKKKMSFSIHQGYFIPHNNYNHVNFIINKSAVYLYML